MPKNDKGEETYTIAICGGGATGKTSISVRWQQNIFSDEYDPTIENQFCLCKKIDGKTTHVNLIDTAGQDEYSSLQDAFMRTAYGFVLVFDCTNLASMDELTKYTSRIARVKLGAFKDVGDGREYPVVIVANKSDLATTMYTIPETEAKMFIIKELGLPERTPLIVTSAKTNHNIKEALETTVREMRDFEEKQLAKKSNNKVVTPQKSHTKSLFKSRLNSGDVESDLSML